MKPGVGLAHPLLEAGKAATRSVGGIERSRACAEHVFSLARTKLALAAVLVLSLPALSAGFFYDDRIHRLALEQGWAGYARDAFSLYEFNRGPFENRMLMEVGLHPWFATPALAIRFFRPLSSLLVAFDLYALGGDALLAHLHSLLWFGGLVAVVWRLFHYLAPARVARLATLVFACSGVHAEPLAWVASRHVLVGSLFALLAWVVLLRPCSPRARWPGALSAFFLALALCSSEVALCVLPFVFGQIVFDRRYDVRAKIVRALPLGLLVAAYVALYVRLGYGVRASGGYVDPLADPLRYAMALIERIPPALAQLFVGLPASLPVFVPALAMHYRVIGVAAAAGVLVLALRQPAGVRPWVVLAFVASLVPLAASIVVAGRVLVLPMVLAALFLATVLRGAVPGSRVRRALVVLLFALHLGLSPLVRVATSFEFRRLAASMNDVPKRADLRCPEKARIELINGHDPGLAMYGGLEMFLAGRRSLSGWHVLTMAPNDLRLTRLGPHTLLLETEGARRTHAFEQLYRPPSDPIREGDVVRLASMQVTVLDATALGATRMLFDFSKPLDSSGLCFVRWQGGAAGHLESVRLPKTGSLKIEYEPGPMGL